MIGSEAVRRGIKGSLAARLVAAIVLVQVLVLVGGMAAWMLTSPYVTWDDVAAESASARVLAALGRDAAGQAAVLPAPALLAYTARRPGFGYAVLFEGKVLPGTAPALAAAMASLGPFLPREGQLALPLEGGKALFRVAEAALGEVVVVTAGNVFHADEDLGVFFTVFLAQLVPLFGPALLAMILAMPLAISHALRPLRAMMRAAGEIDLLSLDRRLDASGAPSELRPFIGEMNALLARIEEGVRRQRVFTGNAAHELRTPVAILRARLESLPDQAPGRDALLRDIGRITILLDQMLAVARLPGTGLGLAIVREVARLHGGQAVLEDSVGGGATFCLVLPALQQPARTQV